ncbi:MAG TPA: hypothetical protein VFJ59_07235 [Pseudolabrys sp.]|nr:hypothetical protein [Pseudolabrys sp.]
MPHPLAVSFIVVTKMSNVSNHAMFGVISADAPADAYRVKAAELNALSKDESYAALRAEFANLARAYLSLAEQAEQSSDLDIAYEAPAGHRPADWTDAILGSCRTTTIIASSMTALHFDGRHSDSTRREAKK